MPFLMRPEVDDWFMHIQKKEPIKTKFDVYYFCLMLGLSTGKSDKPKDAQEFVKDFTKEYKPVQRLIVALMIIAELNKLGVDLSEREEVQIQISKYLDPMNQSNLTEEGFSKMNGYASYGFNYLVSELNDKPRNIEEFLQLYSRLIEKTISENDLWMF